MGSWPLLAGCLPSVVCLVKSTYDLIKRDGCGLPGDETLSILHIYCASQLHSWLMFFEYKLNTKPRAKFHLILKTTQ